MTKIYLNNEFEVLHVLSVASKAYDEIYIKASQLLAEYNVCSVMNGTCKRGRLHKCESFCCGGCSHLSENGCMTKALSCKLWLCGVDTLKEFDEKFHKLRVLAQEGWCENLLWKGEVKTYGDYVSLTLVFRGSKEKTMKDLHQILRKRHMVGCDAEVYTGEKPKYRYVYPTAKKCVPSSFRNFWSLKTLDAWFNFGGFIYEDSSKEKRWCSL